MSRLADYFVVVGYDHEKERMFFHPLYPFLVHLRPWLPSRKFHELELGVFPHQNRNDKCQSLNTQNVLWTDQSSNIELSDNLELFDPNYDGVSDRMNSLNLDIHECYIHLLLISFPIHFCLIYSDFVPVLNLSGTF